MSSHASSSKAFDSSLPMFSFAPLAGEAGFSKTPANVSSDFVQEAMANIAAASNVASSDAQAVGLQDFMISSAAPRSAATASSIPSRSAAHASNVSPIPPASAAASTASTKKRKRPTLRVTSPEETTTMPQPEAAVSKRPAVLGPVKKRQRKAGKPAVSARVIPRCLEECDEADKELISLRDANPPGDWKTIRARWEEITGEKTATSTLPNRYARLKSNFTVIKEEDNAHLILAKREVEASFENQKWELISRVVQEKGGERYAGVVLKRQYKKLMVSGGGMRDGGMPPIGVYDPDFEIELPEEDEVE